MKYFFTALSLASVASAHTLFSNLFIDNKSQGDGTCVRTPSDASKSNSPIYPLTGAEMACGREGTQNPVKYICPAKGSSTLTFDFRESPNYSRSGAIDGGHKGPCSVYVKKVDDIFTDSAAGAGWFKIWEDGYNADTKKWCTETLNDNDGFLSVKLPSALPSGYYLIRPELIALHAATQGDPQFYHGCAQVFVENGPAGDLSIPDEYSVSIPGYVDAKHPGLTFNLYDGTSPTTYQIPGPKVYYPESSSSNDVSKTQDAGKIPSDCILKSANWCAKPVSTVATDNKSCWAAAQECWDQSKVCWDTAAVVGYENCNVWGNYCETLGNRCESKNYDGTPAFSGKEVAPHVPSSVPAPYNQPKGTEPGNGGGSSSAASSSTAAAATSTAAAVTTSAAAAPTSAPAATSTAAPVQSSSAQSVSTKVEDKQASSSALPSTTLKKCVSKVKTVWQTVTVTAAPARR
ncbi:unnamed protein product [Clonostachys solani]|uniref:lytic cellulose monooxygenase (C4-dehydrogenating) n=1 Tax=Clonostachys solani TaxID=160281 RepID=A0A9N9Z3X3_9HYPO|nr:unnamed protein product [Clonostachys solani]